MGVERITDADDPRLADYRGLANGGPREAFVVEGRRLVRRLLDGSRFRTRSVLLTERALVDLRDALADGLPVYVGGAPMIRRLVGFEFHRGCLAAGERGETGRTDDLLSGRLLVVLERTTSPDNIGAVFRNAGAFGADAVLLSPGCGDPLYRRAIRVSMGGSLRVPFAVLPAWHAGLATLRDAGFTIVALTPDGGVDIGEFGRSRRLPDRVALVLGAEGEGLGPDARAAADLEVRIPLAPGDHSLNLATACGIALHRFANREGSWT